ncbi:MAG: hemerythrin family protein [Gammaproteobacteria bacterium]|nr:hemerythrin family protein [Gammaproteobacteria bacterium]
MIKNAVNPFRWSSDFSVDIAELDDDHKILFELLNHLRATIESGDASALPLIIDDLLQYSIYHFRHEEDMMEACHYLFLDNHKLVHRMLETRLSDFIKNPEYRGDLEAATWLLGFFENWLKDHVAGMDKNYSECIRANEEGGSHAK